MPGVGSLRWACTFHELGDANLTQRQPVFWWNMGFTEGNETKKVNLLKGTFNNVTMKVYFKRTAFLSYT